MTFLSARRIAVACAVTATAGAALVAPGAAFAKEKLVEGERNAQCSGPNVSGIGSTFQAPILFVWTGYNWNKSETLTTGFNHSTSPLACPVSEEKPTPVVRYNQEEANRGSGACLKSFGAGAEPKVNKYAFCGTDEAPSETALKEMEKASEGGEQYVEGEGGKQYTVESIPVLQGSVAVIVHLPSGCTASAGNNGKPLTRLVLDNTTVDGIYRGEVKTWKEVEERQGAEHGEDKITCANAEEKELGPEEKYRIHVVVRADKSGTTHIFKKYLAQVEEKAGQPAVEFEKFGRPHGENPCKQAEGEEKPEELSTYEATSEGCQNQRWATEASVIRPSETGNPGVVNKVNSVESSVGYADLAVAREYNFFSSKTLHGGENSKTEHNHEFWAEVQNTEIGVTPVLYQDPSTDKDITKAANSNCAATVYAAKAGEVFPPPRTKNTWAKVRANIKQTHYPICGVTYDLAAQHYYKYLEKFGVSKEEAKAVATSVENFLHFDVYGKEESGGIEAKNHDYEKLSGTVLKEAEEGVKEIGV